MSNRTRVLKEVRRWVLTGQLGEKCRVIALRHLEGEGASKPVAAWDIKGHSTDVDLLVNEILEVAQNDAEGIGDTQRYALQAYFGEQNPGSSTGYGARLPFAITVAPVFEANDTEAGIVSSDTIGNPKMQAATAMKFAMDTFRHVIPWSNSIMAMQHQMMQRMEAQVNESFDQQKRLLVLTERMLSRNHIRKLQTRKLIKHEQRKDEMAAMFMPLIPVVISALAGKPALAAAVPPPKGLLPSIRKFEAFIKSVREDPETLAALQSKLKPTQIPAVMQIVAQVNKGEPINPSVLVEFLKTVDEPQMQAWERELSEDQVDLLRDSIEAAIQKDKQDKDAARRAYAEMNDGSDDEEDNSADVDDDEAFE